MDADADVKSKYVTTGQEKQGVLYWLFSLCVKMGFLSGKCTLDRSYLAQLRNSEIWHPEVRLHFVDPGFLFMSMSDVPGW